MSVVALSFDVLLVTAVSAEFKALKEAAEAFGLGWKKCRGEAVVEYRDLGVLQGDRVAVFKLDAMGSFSARGSAFTCHRALQETSAASIIAVGIAFGVDENRQAIGDILISRAVHLYDEGTVVDDPMDRYRYRYDASSIVRATERWVDRFRSAAEVIPPSDLGSPPPRVHVGRLLAGGARIESAAFRDHLVERVGTDGIPVVGGEMEAAGVSAACAAVGSSWVVVKAISDFADVQSRSRIKETRQMAAESAARFTLQTLMQPQRT